MSDIDIKKWIFKLLPLAIFFYLASKAGQAFRLAEGADISARILNIGGGFSAAFVNPLPSFHPKDVIVGLVGAGFIALALQMKRANAKKYRRGIEYGSARFGTAAFALAIYLIRKAVKKKNNTKLKLEGEAILKDLEDGMKDFENNKDNAIKENNAATGGA